MGLKSDVVYLPWSIVSRLDVSTAAKMVYGVVVTEDEWPSLEDIAKGTGLTEKQVLAALNELHSKGLSPEPGLVTREREAWTSLLSEYGLTPKQAEAVMCAGPRWSQALRLQEFGFSEEEAQAILDRICSLPPALPQAPPQT